MIIKAILAVINYISDFIFSILPSFPILPAFVGQALNTLSELIINSVGILRYFIGTPFPFLVDFLVVLYGWKYFIIIFNFIKRYILLK